MENGREFEIGIWPVLYGFRVRGYYPDDLYSVQLDWCCGNDMFLTTLTIELMKKLIIDKVPIDSIPRSSAIKPWNRDVNFVKSLADLEYVRR